MIELHNSISVSLMVEICDKLRHHNNLDLSHILVSRRATPDWEILANFKGNGLYPARYIVIQTIPEDFRRLAEIFAQDLNTLFNLTVPENLANT